MEKPELLEQEKERGNWFSARGLELVMSVEQMEKDREGWLRARNSGIGGSEIAAVLDMSNWGDPFSVWSRKISPTEIVETEDTERMRWGRRLEASIANGFAEDFGLKLRKCGLMRRVDKPWMLCSVDRLVVGKDEGVEIKTSSGYMKHEWPEGGLPLQYYFQVQWYLACTGFKKWWVACLLDNQLIVREVERNDDDIKKMEEAAETFWTQYVIPKKMPPVSGSEHCTKAIVNEYPGEYGEKGTNVLEMDGKYVIAIDDIKKLDQKINALADERDKLKNEIRLQLGNTAFGHAGKYNISFKPSSKTTVDSKKLKERYPNIFEECKKVSNQRNLIITISKDPERQ